MQASGPGAWRPPKPSARWEVLSGDGAEPGGIIERRESGATGLRGRLWAADRMNLIRVMPAQGAAAPRCEGLPERRRRWR